MAQYFSCARRKISPLLLDSGFYFWKFFSKIFTIINSNTTNSISNSIIMTSISTKYILEEDGYFRRTSKDAPYEPKTLESIGMAFKPRPDADYLEAIIREKTILFETKKDHMEAIYERLSEMRKALVSLTIGAPPLFFLSFPRYSTFSLPKTHQALQYMTIPKGKTFESKEVDEIATYIINPNTDDVSWCGYDFFFLEFLKEIVIFSLLRPQVLNSGRSIMTIYKYQDMPK